MSVAERGFYVVAPDYVDLEGPAVFLAGPIRGSEEWQPQAQQQLQRLSPQLHVCSPRRPVIVEQGFEDEEHTTQVKWETHYLNRCAEDGGIIFWLAAESYPTPGRSYAQTTRFELGEWKERAARDNVKLALGIEKGFTNSRYIRHRFTVDCPGVPICETLEDTCAAMVDLLADS